MHKESALLVHEERKEIVPVKDVQLRVLRRLGICRPWLPVEEGHLAEEFSRTQQRQGDLVALPSRSEDPDLTADNDVKGIPRFPSAEEGASLPE